MNFDQWGWFFFRWANEVKSKKKIFTKNGTLFFPPNLSGDLRSDAHQSQIIGGEANVDHTQIIGGDTVKIFGGYIPPSPRFRHPCLRPTIKNTGTSVLQKQSKKSSSKIFFRRSPKKQKKVWANFPQSFWHFLTKFWPFKEYSAVLGQDQKLRQISYPLNCICNFIGKIAAFNSISKKFQTNLIHFNCCRSP